MRRRRLAAFAAAICSVAVLVVGYVADGVAGLADAGAAVTVITLVVARLLFGYRAPRLVMQKKTPVRRCAVSAADFPDYQKFIADLTWAQLSRRDYEQGAHKLLARLGAALGAPPGTTEPPGTAEPVQPVAGHPGAENERAEGIGLAALTSVVARLEEL